MKYIKDYNDIKNQKKYQPMLKKMQEEVDDFVKNFHDDPKVNSEWGHYYFCDEDGGRLIFDLNKPKEHVCEICGKTFTNPIFDGVWVYMYRNQAILNIWKSAILFKTTNNEKYLNSLKTLLDFYVENYDKFQLHNKERETFDTIEEAKWGCGKILPQGLNESIILIRLVNALEIVKDDLTDAYKENITQKLFIPAFELLKPQVNMIHNIRCWMNSAIGVMGFFSGNQEMIDFVFKGEYNIKKQIAQGVTDDYFWYEGSIHYDFFTLEGMMNLALFAKLYNYDGFNEELKVLEKMLIAAYDYAFDNDYFPNPNDGWPSINLKTYSYIYYVGNKVFGPHSEVHNILNNIENNKLPRTTLPLSKPYYFENKIALEQLLFGQDINPKDAIKRERKSKNFEKSNYALLRNDLLNIFVKYGHNSPSHAHPDKMNIEVMIKDYILTRDLSNAGYRARLCNEWHRVSASHNTVVVDGVNQANFNEGITHQYSENFIEAIAPFAYEGVEFRRSVELLKDGFVDIFKVDSDDTHTFDYFFHLESDVEINTAFKKEKASLGFNKNGYEHISNVYRLKEVPQIHMTLGKYHLTCDIDSKGLEVFITNTLDNPTNRTRKTIVLRKVSKSAMFKLKWHIKQA